MSEGIPYDPDLPVFADVSHYHLIRDEASFVKASTAKILAFKVNEGAFTDKTLAKNIDIALRNNLIQIGYEFDHDSDGSRFLSLFPPIQDRIACIDCEATDLTLIEAEVWVKKVREAYGRQPLCYGRAWFMGKNIKGSALSECPFWLAQYGNHLNVPEEVPSGQVFAWQFSDGASGPQRAPRTFPGIGPCDISSVLNESLLGFAGVTGSVEGSQT